MWMGVCKVEGRNASAGKLAKRKEKGVRDRERAVPAPPPLFPRKLQQGSLWGQVESCPPPHICIVSIPTVHLSASVDTAGCFGEGWGLRGAEEGPGGSSPACRSRPGWVLFVGWILLCLTSAARET